MNNMNLSFASCHTVPSEIRKMFEKAKEYPDAINLTVGEPGFITPKHIIDAGVEYLQKGRTKYASNAGIKELRDALAEKLRIENGIKCDPDKNLIVTAGATQALMLTMVALVNPGDEVILQGPSWSDYIGQIQMVNAVPVFAQVKEENDFKMTAEIIEPLITEKTKLIMLNSPSNPTGGVIDEEELHKIAAMIKRHKVFVISDEPYEKIVYDGFQQKSLAAIEGMEEYVVTINSFSKSYAMTGWRIGYIHANERIVSNLIKLHENMVACVNEAFQLAAVEALRHGAEDIERMRKAYEKNRNLIVEGLNRLKGFTCLKPRGAFYVFPGIRGLGMCSKDAAELILEKTHVLVAPGSAFGDGGEGHLRICYAGDYNLIKEALNRMEQVFGTK